MQTDPILGGALRCDLMHQSAYRLALLISLTGRQSIRTRTTQTFSYHASKNDFVSKSKSKPPCFERAS